MQFSFFFPQLNKRSSSCLFICHTHTHTLANSSSFGPIFLTFLFFPILSLGRQSKKKKKRDIRSRYEDATYFKRDMRPLLMPPYFAILHTVHSTPE